MKKNFVLDTNILIHNPEAVNKFEDNNVFIPHPVIEELDALKTAPGETGYSAREAIRILSDYRKKGSLSKGVKLSGGGMLYTYVCDSVIKLPKGWSSKKQDNLILSTVLAIKTDKAFSPEGTPVVLVSNDGNMQLKADALGIDVQVYKNDRVKAEKSVCRKERTAIYINDEMMEKLGSGSAVSSRFLIDPASKITNDFFIGKGISGGSFLLKEANGSIMTLRYSGTKPFGLSPRNAGQHFLMEALMEPHTQTPLVLVNGPAGTGKTLLALGCGLEQVIEQKTYKRVLICRPNITMDEELGFLPGSEQDKISPLLRGCYDNLERLVGSTEDDHMMLRDKIRELFDREYIQAQAVAYLRGRSITDTFIIIDEAQNTTPNQILSIITRAGEGSKIVILGDVNQIDTPRLDSQNNGLIYAMEKMRGSKLCRIVTFEEKECTRSDLAKEASKRLKR